MSRFGAIGGDGEALLAAGDELDRAVEPFGGERNEPGAWRQLPFRAEGAADKRVDDADLSRVDAERFGGAVLEPINELARLIDGQPVVLPGAGRGEELDRIVMLGGRRIFLINHDVGLGERRVDIAGGRRFLDALRDLGGVVSVSPGASKVALGVSAS